MSIKIGRHLMQNASKKFNDYLFRWIGIPVTGTLAFALSAWLNNTFIIPEQYTWSLLYFMLISFALWHSNMLVTATLRKGINKNKNFLLKILIRYTVTVLITFLISYILLEAWNKLLQHNSYTYKELLIVQIILTFISVLVSSIYEIIYLSKEKDYNLIKAEKSEQLKMHAQLDVLKSQIDPHFIFNSLNTLSYLINIDPVKAQLFNDTLAKVYRYILINKEKDMVQLKEEIEFASHNYYLLRIRYHEGLQLHIKMDNIITENYLIPPLSLQTLIENAIKHNHFSAQHPLKIEITITEKSISVTNNKRIKKFDVISSKIGLLNLNERYKLIINKTITIDEANEQFSVLLPIINC